MIRAYWLRIVLFAAVFGAAGYLTSMGSPKRYEATAQIMIDQQQISASMPMTPNDRSSIDILNFARPRSIETQVEQLTSFGVLEEAGNNAAAALGPRTGADAYAASACQTARRRSGPHSRCATPASRRRRRRRPACRAGAGCRRRAGANPPMSRLGLLAPGARMSLARFAGLMIALACVVLPAFPFGPLAASPPLPLGVLWAA
jgi:hypothetical protein